MTETAATETARSIPVISALRRSRMRWRILAFLAVALLLVAMTLRIAGSAPDEGPYVARVVIDGIITTSAERQRLLEQLRESDRAEAVIVRINSPGGSTAGGEELYESLLRLSEDKPVVAVIDELGASAAYMTAIGTDRIFARRLSLVGSIGVLVQHVDAGGLLEMIGVDLDKVVSGPLKAEPDYDEPLTGEARESLQALVNDSFEWFVEIVAERRGLSMPDTLELADGRIVNGRVALEAGLIDAFGGEAEAQAWLEEQGLAEDLDVRTVYPRPQTTTERLLDLVGFEFRQAVGLDRAGLVPLDGLVSLWHVDQ